MTSKNKLYTNDWEHLRLMMYTPLITSALAISLISIFKMDESISSTVTVIYYYLIYIALQTVFMTVAVRSIRGNKDE